MRPYTLVFYPTDADQGMAMWAAVTIGEQPVPAVCDGWLDATDVG